MLSVESITVMLINSFLLHNTFILKKEKIQDSGFRPDLFLPSVTTFISLWNTEGLAYGYTVVIAKLSISYLCFIALISASFLKVPFRIKRLQQRNYGGGGACENTCVGGEELSDSR
jgi:hypothetical protein